MSDGKLFIGGLSWDTSDEEFLAFFQEFGAVTDHIIMRKPDGQSRGFGFVTFDDPDNAQKVVRQDLQLGGRRIDCKPAVPKDANSQRFGGGGSYGSNRGSSGPRTCKIFVGGLSRDTHKEEFEGYFGKYGLVVDAIVMVDRETQRSRGFGFVTFDNEHSVDNVLSQSVHIITDKQVECKRAIPKESLPTPPNPSAGGYGGGSTGGYGGGYTSRGYGSRGGYAGSDGGVLAANGYPAAAASYQQAELYPGGTPAAYSQQVLLQHMAASNYGQAAGYAQAQGSIPQPAQAYAAAFNSYATGASPYAQSFAGIPGGSSQQSDPQGSYGAVSKGRDTRSYHPYGRR